MKTILHSVDGRTFEIQFAMRTVASHDMVTAFALEDGVLVSASSSMAVVNADEIGTAFDQVVQGVKEQLNRLAEKGPSRAFGLCPPPAHRWTMIQNGSGVRATDPYGPWQVSTKEFREDLQWAIIVEGQPAEPVRQLLAELTARGIAFIALGPLPSKGDQ